MCLTSFVLNDVHKSGVPTVQQSGTSDVWLGPAAPRLTVSCSVHLVLIILFVEGKNISLLFSSIMGTHFPTGSERFTKFYWTRHRRLIRLT